MYIHFYIPLYPPTTMDSCLPSRDEYLAPERLAAFQAEDRKLHEQHKQQQKLRENRLKHWLSISASPPAPEHQEPDCERPAKRTRLSYSPDYTDHDSFIPNSPIHGCPSPDHLAYDNPMPAYDTPSPTNSRGLKRGGEDTTSHKRGVRRKIAVLKSIDDLQDLEVPVLVKKLPYLPDAVYNILHPDIHALYDRLRDASSREKIFPHEIELDLQKLGVKAPASAFHTCTSNDAQAKVEATRTAHTSLTKVLDIVQASSSSSQYKRHESGWNHFVHTPVLHIAFTTKMLAEWDIFEGGGKQPEARARYEAIMDASIAGDCVPLISRPGQEAELSCPVEIDNDFLIMPPSSASSAGASTAIDTSVSISCFQTPSGSKKVDYAIVLDVLEDSVLHTAIANILFQVDASRRKRHVNQTAYQPINKSPIAVLIETKAEGSPADALLQLGIWVAAWYKRMYYLRRHLAIHRKNRGLVTTEHRLVTIPLIKVVGPIWNIYFACDLGSRICIYGPMPIGSTEDVTSTYSLITCLVAIQEWTEITFFEAMKKWFMCDVLDMVEVQGEA
ncbi:hypothetical protein F4859DRAFT_495689 [Xylaria cf. heliscus]|nr:hypothetical protein F4859DRAFT_495689 [Xylaria cf. heliscus]